jgi:hypothetical protein
MWLLFGCNPGPFYEGLVEGRLPAIRRKTALPLPTRQNFAKTRAHKGPGTLQGRQTDKTAKMSDDSFIREVNEEMRQDQAKALWDRYGPMAIAIAVLVVLATAGWVAYDYWDRSRANADGDRFSTALALANDGKNDEALEALKALETDGYGAYPLLAQLRSGTVLTEKGDFPAAVAAFDAVAGDGSVPDSIRDMARLRAGLILVDNGSFADVSARVEPLTGDSHTLRHAAREALGLSAWKAGNFADALKLFDQVSSDDNAPRNTRERATLLAELIRGAGTAS